MKDLPKYFIKKVLIKTGYEIHRNRKFIFDRKCAATEGEIIEFIGLPACGKTTLMNNSIQHFPNMYVTQYQITSSANYLDICENISKDVSDFYEDILKQSILNTFENKTNNHNISQKAWRIQTITNLMYNTLGLDGNIQIGIFTDEGLAKNFSTALLSFAKKNHPVALWLLKKRRVVFLEATPDQLFTQYKQRREQIENTKKHKEAHMFYGYTDDQIMLYYKEKCAAYKNYFDALQEYVESSVLINRENNHELNVKNTVDFIRNK